MTLDDRVMSDFLSHAREHDVCGYEPIKDLLVHEYHGFQVAFEYVFSVVPEMKELYLERTQQEDV